MKKIRYPLNFIFNIITALANIFIRRDQKVILVGAWMGEKFADNSRFLYQYLYLNKDKLGLKRVIWYTRNAKVYDDLTKQGYDVIQHGGKHVAYWHLKSGVHIICNDSLDFMPVKPDIETRFSWGAKKIQLWHGVGMKSVGADSNKERKKNSKKSDFNRAISTLIKHSSILSSGGWQNCFFLSSSHFNGEVNIRIAGCKENNLLYSCYPRNCECLEYLNNESEIIAYLNRYRKRILFLPTFRDDDVKYENPIDSLAIRTFLETNDVLWIEKSHPADKNFINESNKYKNVLLLDSDFDVNVLYPFVDVVLTDYSSVSFDAIYHEIPLIMYTPDYLSFKEGSVGFLFDISDFCGQFMVCTLDDLLVFLEKSISSPETYKAERKTSYKKLKKIFWDSKESAYCKFIKDSKII